MKKALLIMIILILAVSGCQSKVVKYTSEDAEQYALQKAKTTQANLISVKQKNGDTIWTFQESYDRALTWQTIDHHYMDSQSINESNELVTNYDLRVIAYYFQKYPDFTNDVSISYTYLDTYPLTVIYHDTFTNRESLKQSYDALFSFLAYVKEENASYSDKSKEYEVQADFQDQNEHFVFDTLNISCDTLEERYLSYIMIYHDTDSMQEFTDAEIQTFKDSAQSIYMKIQEEDPWMETEYYSAEKEMKIASTALYDLIQENEEFNIQIEGERDAFTILKKEETYGPFEREMISFYDVQQMTGIYLTNDTKESDTEEYENEKKEVG